jgi:hypothetical protein
MFRVLVGYNILENLNAANEVDAMTRGLEVNGVYSNSWGATDGTGGVAQVKAWVAARGFALGQKMNLPGNWYLVTTPPGAASLTAANAMQESGAVLSATPNWWKQASTSEVAERAWVCAYRAHPVCCLSPVRRRRMLPAGGAS